MPASLEAILGDAPAVKPARIARMQTHTEREAYAAEARAQMDLIDQMPARHRRLIHEYGLVRALHIIAGL
tara:strand:- start:26843 stop:27052 length:210 start_codon:yes stop_codon:yes gene_type:complete